MENKRKTECTIANYFMKIKVREFLANGRSMVTQESESKLGYFFFFSGSSSIRDLSALTRDRTCAPCIGCMDS